MLPLSDFVYQLLKQREAASKVGPVAQIAGYVFPGSGKTGHLIESKTSISKITKETGIKFSPNDLRRMFITVAEGLDLSPYALKMLVNHKIATTSDVTGGYMVHVNRLKEPMQRTSDRLSGLCGAVAVLEMSAKAWVID